MCEIFLSHDTPQTLTLKMMVDTWGYKKKIFSGFDMQWSSLQTGGDISAHKLIDKVSDVMLGTTTLPLKALLSHRTGIEKVRMS